MSLDLDTTSARLPAGPGVRTKIDYAVNVEPGADVLHDGRFRTILAMEHCKDAKGFDVVLAEGTQDEPVDQSKPDHDPLTTFWRYDDLVAVRA